MLLRKAGIERGRHEASILLAGALGETKERLYGRLTDPLLAETAVQYESLLRRRSDGLPVAYLLGQKEFFGRTFLTDPRALIPRPDTEILVEQALKLTEQRLAGEPLLIHDCCTGTGCVAISIAAELTERGYHNLLVSGSDQSPSAVELAKENGERLLPGTVSFFEADLLSEAGGENLGPFDIITANPPYLTPQETDDALSHGWGEPKMALDGGAEGLDLIDRLISSAMASLRKNGYILIEAADHQAVAIRALLLSAGFAAIETARDLAGKERVTLGRYDSDNR